MVIFEKIIEGPLAHLGNQEFYQLGIVGKWMSRGVFPRNNLLHSLASLNGSSKGVSNCNEVVDMDSCLVNSTGMNEYVRRDHKVLHKLLGDYVVSDCPSYSVCDCSLSYLVDHLPVIF